MKVYLSGAISSLNFCDAVKKFKEVEAWAKVKFWDCEIINPLSLNKGERDWKKCMAKDLKALMDCDAIVLQKNWKQSKGARIERFIAKEMGMRTFYYEY